MKNCCLFLLVSLFTNIGFAQEEVVGKFKYKATYDLTWQIDSTDAQSVQKESMVLYICDKISRFSSWERLQGDSVLQYRKRNPSKFTGRFQGAPQTKFDYYIYKEIPKGKFSFTRKVVKDNLRYVGDLDQFQWEIQPETKEIAGYKSQKATTKFAGRDYEAWFTSEIPIPDGPYKFNGLPGLILEVRDQKDHYAFVLTDFKILKKPVPMEFFSDDYITVSKSKLQDAVINYKRNPFAAMERIGISFGFEPGQRERIEKQYKEELKKQNNPLELE